MKNQSQFLIQKQRKTVSNNERTPQSQEKYQRMSSKLNQQQNTTAISGSPIDNYKGYSPQSFYKQKPLKISNNSPQNFSNFQFATTKGKQQSNQNSVMIADYSSQQQQNTVNMSNLNIHYSTKDNTKLSIPNPNHTHSSSSTILGITNGFISNITIDQKLNQENIQVNDQQQPSGSGKRNISHKPPLIPSLKGKIYQTNIGGNGQQTSKSGYVVMSQLTGITNDEKFNQPYDSRHQGAIGGSFFNLHTVNDDLILSSDLQSVVEYRLREDEKVKQFIDAQNPFMFIDMKQSDQQNNQFYQAAMKKRMIYSTLQELDRSISEIGLSCKYKQEQAQPTYEDWLIEMREKVERNKVNIA